jgi:hypothetical protein
MRLWESINAYVGREVNFIDEVILRNDTDGEATYIDKWNVLDKPEPTIQELISNWNYIP